MPTPSGHTTAVRAKKVIGAAVHNTQGEKIGTVEDIVLDKLSNNVMFAVVGFGGFLNMGEKYHAIPWSKLDYNESKMGYVVPFSKQELETAPAASIDELTRNDGSAFRDRAYTHFKAEQYWN